MGKAVVEKTKQDNAFAKTEKMQLSQTGGSYKVKTTKFIYLPPNSACKLKQRKINPQQNNKSLMDAWAFYYFASFSQQNGSDSQTTIIATFSQRFPRLESAVTVKVDCIGFSSGLRHQIKNISQIQLHQLVHHPRVCPRLVLCGGSGYIFSISVATHLTVFILSTTLTHSLER